MNCPTVALSLTALIGLVTATPADEEKPWFTRCLVGMETGPTGAQFGHSDPNDSRYAAHFDGAGIVRHCLASHAGYLVLWARDGDYAYYDSKLLPKAPGLGKRNPLREAVEEARPHRLPVIAYCVVQQGGHFLKAHPEFEMRGADGKPIGRFCFNSGYLEAMKALLSEQLAYGIDGFHLDMLDQGFGPPYGCWCAACQGAFEKEFGRPMPKGATWDGDWDRMLEFRYATSDRFEKALTAHIKSIKPDATVDFNYHGNPPFSFELGQRPVQHAANGDFVTGETGVWGFSALTVGLNAAFYRAAAPGKPYQVAMQRGVRMYHDQTTRPLADLRWELFTLLAHGALVTMVDKTGFDGSLDEMAYGRIGEAFKEAGAKRAEFGQEPVQEVGIYYSSRTRDWVGRDHAADYFAGFLGAHKAMVYEHIPWGVILDENVSLASLKAFPVVLLPDTGIVCERELALFRSYVEEGGKLIVTGLSGCYDQMGRLQAQGTLDSLTGARFVRKLDSPDNWVRFSGECFPNSTIQPVAGAPPGWAFLVKGPAGVFEPATAQPVGELWRPFRTTRQLEGKEATEWPMSAETPAGPAILINHPGKGTVLTFACSPDAANASEHALTETRKLLANAVRLLHPEPLIRISAPASVEAAVTDDPTHRVLRVHLLGYNSPPQTLPAKDRPMVLPVPIEDAPMYRVVLQTNLPIKQVEALNPSTVLKRQDSRIEAVVEDVHEVLKIAY